MAYNYYKILSLFIGKNPKHSSYDTKKDIFVIDNGTINNWKNHTCFFHSINDSLDIRYLKHISPKSFSASDSEISPSFLGYCDALINIKFFDENKRCEYYEKGIIFDKKKYVRYKRSIGAAKKGCCLFILESLYRKMSTWSNCSLRPNKIKTISQLTSWEAYNALTLSGIQNIFKIEKKSILIMPDLQSNFEASGIAICLQDSPDNSKSKHGLHLCAEATNNIPIKNIIWDGECLIDESVFSSLLPEQYKEKSMILLRNRFFKSCGFRTKLQTWFKDNLIPLDGNPSDYLNGYTTASKISEIKIVITESSLKYLKFLDLKKPNSDENKFSEKYRNYLKKGLDSWFEGLNSGYKNKSDYLFFGIVKSDKPSHYMNGTMVYTNYQLLNTLGLTEDETRDLLYPTLSYFQRAKTYPLYHRHFLSDGTNFYLDDCEVMGSIINEQMDDYDDEENPYISDTETSSSTQLLSSNNFTLYNYKYALTKDFLFITDDFSGTKICQEVRQNINTILDKKTRKGRFLIEGTYATLFGNPIEFLCAIINKHFTLDFAEPDNTFSINGYVYSTLKQNEIYSKLFSDGSDICGARSPHITMGNLFLGKVRHNSFIDTYFSLSAQIVCVNSIRHNILQALNGADFDSDTMLITNNTIIVDALKRQGDLFPTPVNTLFEKCEKIKKDSVHTEKNLATIDKKIAKNNIGKIINLSQQLNSIFWDRYTNIKWIDEKKYIEFISCKDQLWDYISFEFGQFFIKQIIQSNKNGLNQSKLHIEIIQFLSSICLELSNKYCLNSDYQKELFSLLIKSYQIITSSDTKDVNREAPAFLPICRFILSKIYGEDYSSLELLWNKSSDPLYEQICILEVLSNLEIDKAKRIYISNTSSELSYITSQINAYRYNQIEHSIEIGDEALLALTGQNVTSKNSKLGELEFREAIAKPYTTTISHIYSITKEKMIVPMDNTPKNRRDIKLLSLINNHTELSFENDIILAILSIAAYYQLRIRTSHYITNDDETIPDYDLISHYVESCFTEIQSKIRNASKIEPESIIYTLLKIIDEKKFPSIIQTYERTKNRNVVKTSALRKIIDQINKANEEREIPKKKLVYNESSSNLLLGSLWFARLNDDDQHSILHKMIAQKYNSSTTYYLSPNNESGTDVIYNTKFERKVIE